MVGHVARVGERDIQGFGGNPEGKRPLERQYTWYSFLLRD